MPAAERAEDDVLVRRIAEGDRRAWTALVDRHAPPLHRFAWRMLGDQAEAEDVVQDAMMRLLHKVACWEPRTPTNPIFVVNLVREYRRSTRPPLGRDHWILGRTTHPVAASGSGC